MNQNTLAIICIIIFGLLLIMGSILRWEVLVQNKTSTKINNKLGEHGTRIFFVVVGLLLLVMAFYLYQTKKLDTFDNQPVLIQF